MTSSRPGGSTCRVLVVDDDTDFAATLVELLEDEGFLATSACGVETGLALIEREQPDIVLCDVEMPEQSGFDLLDALARSQCPVPVLLMTGSPSGREASRETQASGCLLKPFDKPALISALRDVLGEGEPAFP